MELSLVTPERRITLRNLRQVVFPSPKGETGILQGHAALVSLCDHGVVRTFREDPDFHDTPTCFVVGRGSVRAIGDQVVILTMRMLAENELDAEIAQADLDDAQATLQTLDPVLDYGLYQTSINEIAFCEAILVLHREVLQRKRIPV